MTVIAATVGKLGETVKITRRSRSRGERLANDLCVWIVYVFHRIEDDLTVDRRAIADGQMLTGWAPRERTPYRVPSRMREGSSEFWRSNANPTSLNGEAR